MSRLLLHFFQGCHEYVYVSAALLGHTTVMSALFATLYVLVLQATADWLAVDIEEGLMAASLFERYQEAFELKPHWHPQVSTCMTIAPATSSMRCWDPHIMCSLPMYGPAALRCFGGASLLPAALLHTHRPPGSSPHGVQSPFCRPPCCTMWASRQQTSDASCRRGPRCLPQQPTP